MIRPDYGFGPLPNQELSRGRAGVRESPLDPGGDLHRLGSRTGRRRQTPLFLQENALMAPAIAPGLAAFAGASGRARAMWQSAPPSQNAPGSGCRPVW